jgi:hypothetical protein
VVVTERPNSLAAQILTWLVMLTLAWAILLGIYALTVWVLRSVG